MRKKKKYENYRITQLKLGLVVIAIVLVVVGIKELLTYLGLI